MLREAGIKDPPVQIEPVLDHLGLHRQFYDLQNPDLIDHAKHRIKVGKEKLVRILRKISLVSVLLPDEKKIILDATLPKIRRDWPSFHEVSHRILGWHKPYFFGDTA